MLICLCTEHKSMKERQPIINRLLRKLLSQATDLTVDIRHRSAILVLDEHIAQLDLAAVHILPGNQERRLNVVTLS